MIIYHLQFQSDHNLKIQNKKGTSFLSSCIDPKIVFIKYPHSQNRSIGLKQQELITKIKMAVTKKSYGPNRSNHCFSTFIKTIDFGSVVAQDLLQDLKVPC